MKLTDTTCKKAKPSDNTRGYHGYSNGKNQISSKFNPKLMGLTIEYPIRRQRLSRRRARAALFFGQQFFFEDFTNGAFG